MLAIGKYLAKLIIRDRLILAGIIFFTWGIIKLLEFILPARILDILPGPLQLMVLVMVLFWSMAYSFALYVANRIRLRHPYSVPKLGRDPKVDIFIAAHNEERVIVETLEALLALVYSNFHVYIIDDRSKDSTSSFVSEFIDKVGGRERFTLITRPAEAVPGKPAALNCALALSSGEFVMVLDADARVEPDCLNNALGYFADPRVGGVQFQKRICNAEYNQLAFCQDMEMAADTYVQAGRDLFGGMVEFRGSGMIVSRSCLSDVGGWMPRALTEDLELSLRLALRGWKIRFVTEISVWEEGVIEPKALFRQRRRWAEGSLRRLLLHFHRFFDPRTKMTFLQRLDLLPFATQFAVPFWLFLDVLTQIIEFFTGGRTHITLFMLAFAFVSLLMGVNVALGMRFWRGYRGGACLRHTIATMMYGHAHWPAIVLLSFRKILFGRRQFEWIKTPRMKDSTR